VFSEYLIEQEDGLTVRLASDQTMDGLRLLRAYVNAFSREMSKRKIAPIQYIDLWAGTGKVKLSPSNTILLSSPLIAMTSAKAFHHCHFAEGVGIERTALRQRVKSSDREATVHGEEGNLVVDSVVKDNQAGMNLVFLALDRMQVQWVSVEKLAQLENVECIFDFVRVNLSKAPDTNEKQNLWHDFFGTTDWRKAYQSVVQQADVDTHQHLRDFYGERLQSLGLTYQRVLEADNAFQYLVASKTPIRNELWDAALQQIRQKRMF
jgi:three-Cys-motif partner protein